MNWYSAPARVVVVGPRLDAQGGIVAVNAAYAAAGLFGSEELGLAAQYFPSTRDGLRFIKLAYAALRLARFALAALPPPTVVHLHTTWHASFWRKCAYAWIARAKGAQVIHHIHAFGFLDFYERGGRIRRSAVRATLRRADALIALTEGMGRRLSRIAPEQRVEILPNPVDLVALKIEPVPVRDPWTVMFLGWFIPEKGIYDLLDAVALAARDYPELRLVLGGCRNEVGVHTRIRALGIEDRVEIRGWLNRAQVARALHECAVLALPSHMEGFGLVLVEAMACGTPIVTCPVGGIPEVVQAPRNALFVPAGRPEALRDALIEIVTNSTLRAAMAKSGPEDAMRFDTPKVIGRLREIYHGVLSSRRDDL
jgi:glycosyltransferase involved in cell wall biosynthesis